MEPGFKSRQSGFTAQNWQMTEWPAGDSFNGPVKICEDVDTGRCSNDRGK